MASKVTPYFILTADGVSTPDKSFSDVTTSHGEDLRENVNNATDKKRHLTMSRNELTRKRMDLLQRKLEESRERHVEKLKLNSAAVTSHVGDAFLPHTPHSYVPPEIAPRKTSPSNVKNMEMVPVMNANNQNGGTPYVYFVVSVDKLTKSQRELSSLDENFANVSISTASTNRRSTRHPLSRRTRRTHDDSFIYRNDGSIVPNPGLQRSITMPSQYPRNPPTTPATVTTTLDKTDDGVSDKRRSIGDLTDFNDNKSGCSARLLELPYIPLDQQRKNLGSSNASMEGKAMEVYRKTVSQDSRRVHFDENIDLPNICGNGLSIPRGFLSSRCLGSRPTTMPAIMSNREELDKPKYICPRTAFGTPRQKKNSKMLNLPKIDIVSGVYDELIVKAIESYIHEFPAGSKQTNLARQLLKQLKDRTITSGDLAHLEKRNKSLGKLTIKEIDPDTAKSFEGGAKSSKGGSKRSTKPKTDRTFSTLAPTCFQMAAPGKMSSREGAIVGGD